MYHVKLSVGRTGSGPHSEVFCQVQTIHFANFLLASIDVQFF